MSAAGTDERQPLASEQFYRLPWALQQILTDPCTTILESGLRYTPPKDEAEKERRKLRREGEIEHRQTRELEDAQHHRRVA